MFKIFFSSIATQMKQQMNGVLKEKRAMKEQRPNYLIRYVLDFSQGYIFWNHFFSQLFFKKKPRAADAALGFLFSPNFPPRVGGAGAYS